LPALKVPISNFARNPSAKKRDVSTGVKRKSQPIQTTALINQGRSALGWIETPIIGVSIEKIRGSKEIRSPLEIELVSNNHSPASINAVYTQ
jgi:hypothetical protein